MVMGLLLAAPAPLHAADSTVDTPAPASGWIWSTPGAAADAPTQTVYFRLSFDLPARPNEARVLLAADNSFKLFVNGVPAASGQDWNLPVRQDVAAALNPGRNVLAVEAYNGGGPAGLWVQGRIETGGEPVVLDSGPAWHWSVKAGGNWNLPDFNAKGWKPAALLGTSDLAPWRLASKLAATVTAPAMIPPTDWTAWRQRQREELAALPAPPELPPGDSPHPVDRFMSAWWRQAGVEPPPVCDDATFARRAWLDAIGLLPTEDELAAFLADASPLKRELLVDKLLGDEPAYAEGWMAWWCDLLRNDEQTSIDGLRKPITPWLFAALRDNMPYDRMVAELLNPPPGGPDGYLKGINWRGAINASQRPPVQAAQNVGQVFMATNIKCASCHDHFTRPYMLEDSYGLASFFAEENLEIYRCDKATGQTAALIFPLRDIGFEKLPADADRAARLAAIARMVTSPRNPRFAPTVVNRLWARLMGRGLFEPVDDFTADRANPALLDWLANDFMRRDYNLNVMIRILMTSRAYQLAAVATPPDGAPVAKGEPPPVFVGPPPRHLTSEQFLDGLGRLTGHWPATKTMNVDVPNPHVRAWRHKVPGPLALALGRPLREQVATERVDDPSMLQMLELTNGTVLNEWLTAGARELLASDLGRETNLDLVVDRLHLRALARTATPLEREVMTPMLGTPDQPIEARVPGWQDVCWLIVMNPEYQFIQ